FNEQQWRPFVHVRDAAGAFIRALESPSRSVSGEIFNVGDNRLNLTLAGVAGEIQSIFPETCIERVDNSDIRNYRVCFDKIRRRIGFQCALSLADGIRELKNAFESRRIANYQDIRYHNQHFLAETSARVASAGATR